MSENEKIRKEFLELKNDLKDYRMETHRVAQIYRKNIDELKEQAENNRLAINIIKNLTYPKENREVLRKIKDYLKKHCQMKEGPYGFGYNWAADDFKEIEKMLDGEKTVHETTEMKGPKKANLGMKVIESDSKPLRCSVPLCTECNEFDGEGGAPLGFCKEGGFWNPTGLKCPKIDFQSKEYHLDKVQAGSKLSSNLSELEKTQVRLLKLYNEIDGKNPSEQEPSSCEHESHFISSMELCEKCENLSEQDDPYGDKAFEEAAAGVEKDKFNERPKKEKELPETSHTEEDTIHWINDIIDSIPELVLVEKTKLEKWIWDLKHEISRSSVIKKIEKCL